MCGSGKEMLWLKLCVMACVVLTYFFVAAVIFSVVVIVAKDAVQVGDQVLKFAKCCIAGTRSDRIRVMLHNFERIQ